MEALRDALRRTLRRSLSTLGDEDRLHAAWPLVCGSALAPKAEVLHLDPQNVLHVRVADPAWRERFFEMRSQIAADLGRVAGLQLTGIHFDQVRPAPFPRTQNGPYHGPAAQTRKPALRPKEKSK